MSGNSIHIGILLSQQSWNGMARFACAVVAYVSGMVLTRITVEAGARAGVRRIAMVTLAVEAALLALCSRMQGRQCTWEKWSMSDRAAYFLLIALLAFAMGVQTATLTRVGTLTVYTTFVTGTLTKLAERSRARCFGFTTPGGSLAYPTLWDTRPASVTCRRPPYLPPPGCVT